MEGIKPPPTPLGAVTTPGTDAVREDVQDAHSTVTNDELVRIEFYKTYDVMTGVRIAATLGGFFSMMILLVLYKSYCKPSKSLSEEQLNRAVSAAVEEEDRALAAALEATSFYSSLGKARQSIGSGSQPRFSSPGGGRPSLDMGPVVRYISENDCEEPEEQVSDEERGGVEDENLAPDYYTCGFLSVPVDRRASSVTCSSGDTSYLERRGSAFEMGLPAPPCATKHKLPPNDESWDFYYPIDIQVIQPTPPDTSPSTSEPTLYVEPRLHCLQVPPVQDRMHRLTVDRSEMGLAPLASISSLGSFSGQSSPWLSAVRREKREKREDENQEDSVGSDSVFADQLDTEDEAEEFETDSELEDGFDDDYSFCETTHRPVSRCERQPRFASFDSCDMSIVECSEDSRTVVVRSPRHLGRQHSVQDGVRTKRKLVKTYSEPRHTKQLPPWVERGRSGFVPRRQLSAPASKERTPPLSKASPVPTADERPQLPLPSGSDSDSLTLTQHDEGSSQASQSQAPPTSKRGCFVKQKTIRESINLAPPTIRVFTSCEHLPEAVEEESAVINLEQASRSSSQETLC